MYKKILVTILLLCFLSISIHAQERWTLLRCVQYAMDSNISVRQNEIQARLAAITYKQSKLSQYPTANFTNNDGYRFGKSQNPSTGILVNQNFLSVGLNFQSNVEIFNWYSKRNTILANQWEELAAIAGTDKLKNDIALTVANAYLQVLLTKEQVNIADIQVKQSVSQFDIVNKQVKAGALPELNALEIEAQLASDSANLITAKGNVEQAKYVLKAYMNIDAGAPFDIDSPSADKIPLEDIADLQPESVYALALVNLPQQRISDFKLKAAEKDILAARGALYPTISAYGSLGTNYGYFRSPVYQQVFSGYQPSGLVISNGSGGFTDVQRPVFTNGGKSGFITSDAFGTQFSNNFGQSIGISISVPIFNGWQAKAGYERAKLNRVTLELQKDLDNKTIKQDIYQAYNAAIVAMEKFTSSQKSVDAAQRSFDFASKRFNIGMLGTLELITDQNNLFKAKLQNVLNQFDYVFKMKVLEFYKGQGLKL
ncbi:MAG: TolC family protein [Chitinophagaceae bacterium]|nr:TolC family protein [Chitinophagaceae bacterium]